MSFRVETRFVNNSFKNQAHTLHLYVDLKIYNTRSLDKKLSFSFIIQTYLTNWSLQKQNIDVYKLFTVFLCLYNQTISNSSTNSA